MKLTEIAAEIAAHLKRFENDPVINRAPVGRLRPYFHAGACASGSRIFVTYVSFQGQSSLTRAQAMAYLAALKAGYVGQHFQWERIQQPAQPALGEEGR